MTVTALWVDTSIKAHHQPAAETSQHCRTSCPALPQRLRTVYRQLKNLPGSSVRTMLCTILICGNKSEEKAGPEQHPFPLGLRVWCLSSISFRLGCRIRGVSLLLNSALPQSPTTSVFIYYISLSTTRKISSLAIVAKCSI